ncbi:hypothetical protein [Halorubellus sp. PRR65]|uniref:DUF7573 domain-containing protein n=1 Tax=Halorubellus sp. PRR65 TaxID=3098148 RepID=UPI002B25DAD8|nr:hypothetical protein [Halorubellus sp. PRR65]
MTEDASIDDFTRREREGTTENDGTESDATGNDATENDATDEVVDGVDNQAGDGLEPDDSAASTSRYEPTGGACTACGSVVERLWVADDDDVCAACKPW